MASGRVADLAARLWLVTRFGCCVQVVHDYVADVTVVRPRLSPPCACPCALRPRLLPVALTAGAPQCVGPSMLPTFNQSGGDIVVCEHVTPRWGECTTRGGVWGARWAGRHLTCPSCRLARPPAAR